MKKGSEIKECDHSSRLYSIVKNLGDREIREPAMASFEHPYVPKDLELHDYVPCFLSQSEIVAPYLVVSVVVVALVWILSGLPIFSLWFSPAERPLTVWWNSSQGVPPRFYWLIGCLCAGGRSRASRTSSLRVISLSPQISTRKRLHFSWRKCVRCSLPWRWSKFESFWDFEIG